MKPALGQLGVVPEAHTLGLVEVHLRPPATTGTDRRPRQHLDRDSIASSRSASATKSLKARTSGESSVSESP